tara:strand:+ start:299 stop:1156 length:858 start_codon:yes stop_codon:yes gene_type:complete
MSTIFWYDDISILYDKNYLLEFIPYREFDFNRKLNSIVRLSIYYGIIAYVLTSSKNVLCVPFITLIVTVFLYKNYKNNKRNRLTSLLKNTNNTNSSNIAKKAVNNLISNNSILNNAINGNAINGNAINNNNNNNNNNSINSNIVNSNAVNSLVNHAEEEDRLNQIDSIINDINDSCKLPTTNNPFMNLNTYELSNGDVGEACKSFNNKGIQNIIENKFNDDLYLDSNDLFNRRNSQRQFYTMPNTSVPNGQDDFARWLYQTEPTCKEGGICDTSSGRLNGASVPP